MSSLSPGFAGSAQLRVWFFVPQAHRCADDFEGKGGDLVGHARVCEAAIDELTMCLG